MRSLVTFLVLASLAPAADVFSGQVVVDHSSAPLASAEIRVSRDGQRELVADFDTDREGRFSSSDVPAGDYRVEVRKQGYASVAVRYRVGGDPLIVRLVRYGMISGQITDGQGRAVDGAIITVGAWDSGGFRPLGYTEYNSTPVDERGQYRIYNIPPGIYVIGTRYQREGANLHLYPDNGRPRVFEITGGEEVRGVDFLYTPETLSAVRGKVSPAGPTYAVALTPVDRPEFATAVVVRTERDGGFQMNGVPAGSYTLFASGPARPYMMNQAMLGPNPAFGKTHVDLLGPAVDASLSVSQASPVSFVLAAAETPCAQTAQIKLTPVDDWGMLLESRVDLTIGKEQRVNDLAPARYRVTFTKLDEGCYGVTSLVDLSVAPDRPVPIQIAPAGQIRVHLTGAAVAGWTVVVIGTGKDPVRTAVADDQLRCTFDGVKPGRYRLAARPPGNSARWVSDLTRMVEADVHGGAPTELDVPVAPVEKQQ